jgi:hypothetical protein
MRSSGSTGGSNYGTGSPFARGEILMRDGWISLHRKIMDWEFYFDEPFTKTSAWIDMLLLANHQRRAVSVRGNVVYIERGQLGHSTETLAERWHWSRGRVLRFIHVLETEQQIVQQKSHILNVITIKNYNQYQTDSTTYSTTDGQQTDTNNNDNNENKKNTLSDFDKFWIAYPKKIGKGAALKAWNKIHPTNGTFEKIIKSLLWQRKSEQWTSDKGQYIPNPSTYLNQSRWEDEPLLIQKKEKLIL